MYLGIDITENKRKWSRAMALLCCCIGHIFLLDILAQSHLVMCRLRLKALSWPKPALKSQAKPEPYTQL